jgi:plastocyanin
MKTICRFRLIAIAILLCCSALPALSKRWVVTVKDFSFNPVSLTHVQSGDTIQWVWQSGIHTTTSTSIPNGAMPWDTPITEEFPLYELVPLMSGTYSYECTPHASMGMKGSFTVTGTYGINDPTKMPDVDVSPNPFTSWVIVRVKEGVAPLTSLQVISTDGRTVLDFTFDPPVGLVPRTLELKELPRGTYLFRFTDKSDRQFIRRLIRK